MSEDTTQEFPGKKTFDERVFERFDAMDARLEKLEAGSYDIKPIWERALKAIMDLSKEVVVIRSDLGEVKTRTTVIESAVAGLTADVTNLKTDVGTLKTDVADLKRSYGSIANELVDIRREVRENVRHELSHILKLLIEDRQDIRDAESRIRNLETKLA